MNINVKDNFLPKIYFDKIQSTFLDNLNFPWFLNNKILEKDEKSIDDYKFQFTHTLYRENVGITSNIFQDIKPLIDLINPKILLRVKANLGVKTSEHIEGGFHTDTDHLCNTAVFYLNDNNGFTLFENGEKIESKSNRFVVFDSNIKHTGVSQTDTNVRCVININYIS